MTTLLVSQGVGKPPQVIDLLAKYGEPKTGRWAWAPQKPDRCYHCPLRDIRSAIGYRTDNLGWRLGYCEIHKPK